MAEIFDPSEATRQKRRELLSHLGGRVDAQFFAIWEAEMGQPDAPRRAGSVVAAAYMAYAARYAVFGARCAGAEPSLELWMELAREEFDAAVKAVEEAFATSESSVEGK